MALRPARGRIARCEHGYDGLIYGWDRTENVWYGVRLSDPRKLWQARSPRQVRRAVIITDRRSQKR